MKFLRYRLLTVIVIGVITSALSIIALARVVASTAGQRRERALDAVNLQIERLVTAPPAQSAKVLREPAAGTMIGMRGGYLDPQQGVSSAGLDDLPAAWREPLTRVVKGSAQRHGRLVREESLGSALLVLGAEPAAGGIAWAGLLVVPPHYWRFWMTMVILLTLATALLGTTAVSAIVSFRRSAAALKGCLRSLAQDLSTPVPRPRVRELIEVADGILLLAQSLAQAREAQERLAHELAQKERLAALGRVVAGVAHEVRNPLASIKLRLDLAALGGALPPAAELAVAHASSEIARLDRLVADLLVVAGRQMGPRRLTSLGALLGARVEVLAPWAASRGVVLHTRGDAAAVIDVESVTRAVDNMLRNAIEASPRGAEVLAHVVETATAVLVRVEDRGPGIPAGAELFEPFYTTKPDGTGLGLALSRAIARAHGGDVTYRRITGDSGAVTRFELTLSRHAVAAPAPANLPGPVEVAA